MEEPPVSDGDDYNRHRQIVPVEDVTPISQSDFTSSSITPFSPISVSPTNKSSKSKFTLPKGWYVKKVLRRFGGLTDKYYRDPETGRYFRSLKEVERYVTEGVTPTVTRVKKLDNHHDESVEKLSIEGITPTRSRGKRLNCHHVEKMLDLEEDTDNKYQLAIVSPKSVSPSSSFKLPEGWVVEEVPRRSGVYTDKYYYEPGTGQKFRSMASVRKYLAEMEDNSPLSAVLEEIKENNLPLSKAFKLSSPIKNCGSYNSWKKSVVSRKEKNNSPPSKINWVIAGNGGDAWNAFMGETLVPDSEKQQWGNTFMMAINNTKHNAPVPG